MRILFVAHTYLRWAGDRAGAQVYRFAEEAVRRGHEVLVVAPHAAGAHEGAETLEGVAVERFRYASDAGERIGYQGAVAKSLGSWRSLAVLPRYLRRFRRAVRDASARFKPDVISVHWWAPGALATHGMDLPVAVTCHGSDVRLLEGSALVRLVGRRVLGRATAVSAVSQLMADDLRRATGRTDIIVTSMPVDDARFVAGPGKAEPPIVLFAGNIIRAKGVDLIIRAAAQLRAKGIAFRLRFAGDGPHRPEFEALADSLGIASQIEWVGPVAHAEMPDEFSRAAVFVIASRGPRGEGLPFTVMEALFARCAVVATPAGGIPELVEHEVTGLLVRDGDVDGLAAALARVLTDTALRARLAEAGQARALARHAWKPAMDHFFAFLAATATRRGA